MILLRILGRTISTAKLRVRIELSKDTYHDDRFEVCITCKHSIAYCISWASGVDQMHGRWSSDEDEGA